ncbi:hypothetical protein HUJ05_006707 [Dendroctonus ponderosae]|nr:hypothetical protein HUJ05_006707 [Dendroctonus ponderosae]
MRPTRPRSSQIQPQNSWRWTGNPTTAEKFSRALSLRVQQFPNIDSPEERMEAITSVCESTLLKRSPTGRKGVYWWNEEIAEENHKRSPGYQGSEGQPRGGEESAQEPDLEEEKLEDGVEITGYVDDIALVVKAKDLEGLQDKASYKMGLISKKLNDMEIKIAPEKTQIVLVAGRRKIRTAEVSIGGHTIGTQEAAKYLCVYMDRNMRMTAHVQKTIGGPGAAKKRLLASTVQSVVLYGAKAWQKTLRYKGYNSLLDRVNRRLAICITAAYRTISTQVAQVLAGLPPLDLMVEERISIQEDGKASRKLHRTTLIRKWGDYKGWAKVFITDLNVWLQEERYKDYEPADNECEWHSDDEDEGLSTSLKEKAKLEEVNGTEEEKVNRRLAICITAAYRTISTQVAQVLAGLPPLDLMVEERISIQEDGKASRKLHRTTLIRKWGDYKGWAKVFITDLNVWLQEERYKDESDQCWFCEHSDTPEHTIFVCRQFEGIRAEAADRCGKCITKDAMGTILANKDGWDVIRPMIQDIMKTKCDLERRMQSPRR